MPNAVKYKTGNLTGSLQKGNVALGISGSLGPTSTTGWYNGPNPVAGKYQIFETAISGDPEVYSPQDDAELIKFARWKGATGADTGSAAAVLAWIGTQTNLMAANFEYESIVTNGLIVNLDAGFVGSYPTTASTWYDISGNNNNGILTNGPTYNNGSIVFDGVDDYAYFTSPNSLLMPTFTVCSVITPITVNNNGTVVLTNESARLNLGISYGGANGAYFFVTGNNGQGINGTQASYNFSFGTNTKYFVTWIVDIPGKNFQFWVNGTQIWSSNADLGTNFNNPNVNSFVLASRYGGGASQVNIGISTFQFYNKALSSTEITQNYNALKGRFGL